MHAGYLSLKIHTLRLCYTHSFSTATMVTRTRLNLTLHVHYLSTLNLTRNGGQLALRPGRFIPGEKLAVSVQFEELD
jgi:hypothetical protein